jgi:hypothetical protein
MSKIIYKKDLDSIKRLDSDAEDISELFSDFISSLRDSIKQEKREKQLPFAGGVLPPNLDRVSTHAIPTRREYYEVDVWGVLSSDSIKKQDSVHDKYVEWYKNGVLVIANHSSDRLNDFKEHYDSIIKCIKLDTPSNIANTKKICDEFMEHFRVQIELISSLSKSIESKRIFSMDTVFMMLNLVMGIIGLIISSKKA